MRMIFRFGENLRQDFIPSFEEGAPRRLNECDATSSNRRGGGRSNSCRILTKVSDLPGRADSEVALPLFDRRGLPSSKEGKEAYRTFCPPNNLPWT